MPRKVLPALSVSVSLSVAAMLVCSTLAFGQAETILHDFGAGKIEDLLSAIGYGKVSAKQIISRAAPDGLSLLLK